MVSIGNTLREARERQGLTLADVEEKTKIRTYYLNALEEENFAELPGKTYVIGFMRTYARTLGLDPQELVDAYKASIPEPEVTVQPIEPAGPPLAKAPGIPRWLVIAGLCLLAILTLFGINSLSQKGAAPNPKTQPAANPPVAQQQPKAPVPTPQPAPPQPTTPATITDTSQLSMDITFTADCWLIIKSDGQQVYQGKLTSGASKNIKASNSIELVTVGNAGALNITLNGKPLPPLGGMGQVVRNKVFTKNDIPQ